MTCGDWPRLKFLFVTEKFGFANIIAALHNQLDYFPFSGQNLRNCLAPSYTFTSTLSRKGLQHFHDASAFTLLCIRT